MEGEQQQQQRKSSCNKTTRVLLLPWLAHGHISPFLELGKRLAARNFIVYLCSTPVNLHPLKPELSSSPITLVELHLQSSPQLPPHYHTTNGLPSHLMPLLKSAFDNSTSAFSTILVSVSPDLVIYDFLQPWAPSLAASLLHIPSVEFITTSAALAAMASHFYRFNAERKPIPLSSIRLRERDQEAFTELMESATADGTMDITRYERCTERSSKIVLVKTFREIEGEYLDYLDHLTGKKFLPLGPLLDETEQDGKNRDSIVEWLDQKQSSSAVFVSFGSEFFPSGDLIREIAYGLELSGVDFIWVVRFPLGEKVDLADALPEGFFDRVGGRGMVVEGWAPQPAILAHRSVGGFVSHCGWSSVMESMWHGVPIVAVPMHLDQPVNARVVEEIGVGVEVKRDGNGMLERGEIAKVIREVVMEETGEKVRRKAKEMSEVMQRKGDDEVDRVAEELLELCFDRSC
ncbi:unnamed protein product [Linum trigynum]|uniref:Glycosyltransferase n=1 Tax=Linum trigynum TaxID=586398 RepID=A0AAV2DJH5_9ROSI